MGIHDRIGDFWEQRKNHKEIHEKHDEYRASFFLLRKDCYALEAIIRLFNDEIEDIQPGEKDLLLTSKTAVATASEEILENNTYATLANSGDLEDSFDKELLSAQRRERRVTGYIRDDYHDLIRFAEPDVAAQFTKERDLKMQPLREECARVEEIHKIFNEQPHERQMFALEAMMNQISVHQSAVSEPLQALAPISSLYREHLDRQRGEQSEDQEDEYIDFLSCL